MAITGTPAERRSAIWKYAVEVKDEFDVEMPAGGRVLSVQVQDGTPCVWVLVEPENAVARRWFSLRGTGHPTDGMDGAEFVGTFQLRGGALVFHLFNRGYESGGPK